MGLKRKLNLILLVLLATAFVASLPFVSIVQAQTVELVYDSGQTTTSTTTWRLGTYDYLSQSFTVGYYCTPTTVTVAIGDAGASSPDNSFFYGAICGAINDGSGKYYANLSDVYAQTAYLNRYDYHHGATFVNLTFSGGAETLVTGQRYTFVLVKYNGTWNDMVGNRLFWYMANTDTDASNNHAYETTTSGFDETLKVFASDLASAPEYSNVGNGAVNNGYSVSCYSYWWLDKGLLDGYYFEHNQTGTYANSTYTTFSTQNMTWGNQTITVDNALGDVIGYRWFANSSNLLWTATTRQYFTVSATVNFYYTTGGTLRRDGVQISNGTSTTYSTPTTLTMLGIDATNYDFDYYSWYAGTVTDDDNPLSWSVDWTTSLWCHFTDAYSTIPTPDGEGYLPDSNSVELELYWNSTVQTVNGFSGYTADTSPPPDGTETETIDWVSSGDYNVTFTVGWRIFLVHYGGTYTEITGGTPQAQQSVDWTNDGDTELLIGTYNIDATTMTFGKDALEFVAYYRINGTGDWTAAAVFVTTELFYIRVDATEISLMICADYEYSAGVGTTVSLLWDDFYIGGVDNLYVSNPRSSDFQKYYLNAGNFLSFLTIPYVAVIGNTFYALILIGVSASIYIRYRELSMVVLFMVIFGGAGGVIQVVVGDLFMGLIWVACAFGLGLVYWRLFR